MLLQGVRADLIQLGLMALLLLLLMPLLVTAEPVWRLWRRLSALWLIVSVALLVLLEVSSPAFINEYDTRPNAFSSST